MNVISYRGPVRGSVITGDTMGEHDVRPAAALYQRVLGAGVVARLDLLDDALERARAEGAAAALQTVADELDKLEDAGAAGYLRLRANAHRAGLQ